jgi:hypothetical protein
MAAKATGGNAMASFAHELNSLLAKHLGTLKGSMDSTFSQRGDFQRAGAQVLGCILVLACCIPGTKAKATNYLSDDVYNTQHINSLPPEVRALVYAKCNDPRALHNFAEYRGNLRILTLHFEGFLCGISEVRCAASGCLHEVYTLTGGGRYKLMRRYYTREPN